MKVFVLLVLLPIAMVVATDGEIRKMDYNGKTYSTTYNIEKFNGKYSGSKSGYLELRPDGTGTYAYDIFGLAPSDCKRGPIEFDYGFLVDENNEIIRMEREYGYSYPILLQSTGETSFQGCRTAVLLDFIMEKSDSSLGVSSSDDWVKQ